MTDNPAAFWRKATREMERIRVARAWSVEDLARAIGVHHRTLRRIRNEGRLPGLHGLGVRTRKLVLAFLEKENGK